MNELEGTETLDTSIRNVYPDEQEKIEDRERTEIEILMKMYEIVDAYNYDLELVIEEGKPTFKLEPRAQ